MGKTHACYGGKSLDKFKVIQTLIPLIACKLLSLRNFLIHYKMQIQFIKNIQFTRLVKAQGRLREFNFRKYSNEEGDLMFSVDVVDDKGNRIVFRMRREESGWKILPDLLPLWISSNEGNFHDLIEEGLRQAS